VDLIRSAECGDPWRPLANAIMKFGET